MKQIAVATIVLLCGSAALADLSAATARLAEAKSAIAAGKTREAVTALSAIAEMVKVESAAAGEYAQSFARHVAGVATSASEGVEKTGKLSRDVCDVLSSRIDDYYGAIMPAGKGDTAAVVAYLRKLAKSAPKASVPDLESAAGALSEASESDRKLALARVCVALGALIPMDRAGELIKEKNGKAAATWLQVVVGYLEHEARVSDDKRAREVNYLVADARELTADALTGSAVLDEDQLKEVRADILALIAFDSSAATTGAKK